jgi:diguanylate cyclase (GGDEF)-like protein
MAKSNKPGSKPVSEKTELDDFRMLHGVAAGLRAQIVRDSQRRTLASGDALIRQGEPATAMFFLLEGELGVTLHDPKAEPIAIIRSGETVGELGVLDGSTASAHVIARSACVLLALNEEEFWQLLHASHAFSINLLVKLSERLRANNATVTTSMEKRRFFERAAMFDGLTGIHNRRWLDETLHRLVDRSAQGGGPLSLSLIDIDHFKRFNDHHGHEAGDAVLTAVAAAMSAALRPTDLMARFGGEEFVILFPDTPLDDAVAAAERVREVVAHTDVHTDKGVALPRVTISMGVACWRAPQLPADLLKAADVAMYRAKKGGRNRVIVDSAAPND